MNQSHTLKLKFDKEIQVIIGSIAAMQAIYLGILSLLGRGNRQQLILSAFFLAVTLRILKSLLWLSLDSLPIWVINIGFLAHSLTGPLLLLYTFRSLPHARKSNAALLHFIPSICLLGLVFSLTLDDFWYQGGYSFLLFHQMTYVLASLLYVLWYYRKSPQTKGSEKTKYTWLFLLVSGSFLLQATYFSNYVLGLTPYLLGPVLYAPLVYLASWYAFKHPELFSSQEACHKYKNIKATEESLQACEYRLQELMARESPFLNHGCTLNRIARKINTPSYLLSHLINSRFSSSFPDYINQLRIEKAKELLTRPDYARFKISCIAHECGFNSLSSFNAAFKKFTGRTPSGFREGLSNL